MSDSEKNTTGDFWAETTGGGRPLYATSDVRLTLHLRDDPVPYYQGIGTQDITPPDTSRKQYAWLSVYVAENTAPGTYDFSRVERRYRASYAFGGFADYKPYFSVSGKINLEVTPTADDPRLEGTVEFKGETQDGASIVTVTKCRFTLSGLTTGVSGTPDEE
jgi:hypothetical protein